MSLWWLVLIVLVALGVWISAWEDKPITEEEIKDWEDEHESMFDGGDDE